MALTSDRLRSISGLLSCGQIGHDEKAISIAISDAAANEIDALRLALIAVGRRIPGVFLADGVSTDFLCMMPRLLDGYDIVQRKKGE